MAGKIIRGKIEISIHNWILLTLVWDDTYLTNMYFMKMLPCCHPWFVKRPDFLLHFLAPFPYQQSAWFTWLEHPKRVNDKVKRLEGPQLEEVRARRAPTIRHGDCDLLVIDVDYDDDDQVLKSTGTDSLLIRGQLDKSACGWEKIKSPSQSGFLLSIPHMAPRALVWNSLKWWKILQLSEQMTHLDDRGGA